MSKKLITLKPLTPFFFGGENTFGEDNVNYFAKSNYLPQQTTLLGLIRYELLTQNKLLGTDPLSEKWADLIGSKSFESTNAEFTSSFGVIKNISPVFIIEDDIAYIPQAIDWAYSKEDKKTLNPIQVEFKQFSNNLLHIGYSNTNIPFLKVNGKPYDPKMGLKELWVSSDGKISRQWDWDIKYKEHQGFKNGFFIEKHQIGIHRSIQRKREEKGDFYKQIFYQFYRPDTSFAFFVDLEMPYDKKLNSRITTMGGERSVFEMTVSDPPIDKISFNDLFQNAFTVSHPSRKHAIILMSDAYCNQDILLDCEFSITQAIPFRNITSLQMKDIDYASLSRDNNSNKLYKTKELIYLLRRGSVLFPKYGKNILNKIESEIAFKNIGYNYCQEIN